MSDLNIDDFCKDAAKALHLLYRQFPQKVTLYVEDICGPDTPDEFGLHSPRFLAAFSTLVWLNENDYIVFSQTVKQEAVEAATLTHSSFLLLSAAETPATQNDASAPINRIQTLRETLHTKSSESLKALMLDYMCTLKQYR